jgi:hypothetical protein
VLVGNGSSGRGLCCWPAGRHRHQHKTAHTDAGAQQTWLQLPPSPPLSGQRQALGVVGELLCPFLVLLRGHSSCRRLSAARCVSAGAERREGVRCGKPPRTTRVWRAAGGCALLGRFRLPSTSSLYIFSGNLCESQNPVLFGDERG